MPEEYRVLIFSDPAMILGSPTFTFSKAAFADFGNAQPTSRPTRSPATGSQKQSRAITADGKKTHLLDGEKADADATRATRVSCLIMVVRMGGGLLASSANSKHEITCRLRLQSMLVGGDRWMKRFALC